MFFSRDGDKGRKSKTQGTFRKYCFAAPSSQMLTPEPWHLGSGDFDAKFFRQPLPDLFRQPVMHASRAFLSRVEHGYRGGGGYCYSEPNQSGKRESKKRRNLQQERVPRAKVMNHCEGQEKHSRGNGSQGNQPHVDHAMNLLAAAAVFAARKMAFVVAAHLRRQAGYVVSPARQNFTYDWINTLLTHGGTKSADHSSPTTGESVPTLRSGTQGARDWKTIHPAWRALVLLLSGRFPDGCSALTDAPALQTLHYYHSRW